MLETYERRSRTKLIATIVAVLVIAGVVLLADHIRSDTDDGGGAALTRTSSTVQTPTTGSASTTATTQSGGTGMGSSSGAYRDGTYNVVSSYYVPHGQEQIQVSLTLQNGTIASVNVQNSENNFDSAQYQESFAQAYKSHVVGKNISGLRLNVISGASDTTQGFNQALAKIAAQAAS